MYEKWDDIQCDDVNINEKFLCVCPDFEKDSLEELEERNILMVHMSKAIIKMP